MEEKVVVDKSEGERATRERERERGARLEKFRLLAECDISFLLLSFSMKLPAFRLASNQTRRFAAGSRSQVTIRLERKSES